MSAAGQGQRVFITGGASGLGRALAEGYAREGGRVCIGDVNAARGEETLAALHEAGAQAHYLHCDVTREEDLQAAADWLQANWNGVDLVVNNAGVADMGPVEAMPIADWQWMIDINLLGVVRGCKVFAPLMRKQGQGSLLNIASMAGLIHPPYAGAYNATKAAVVALSETLKAELESAGIRVSVACPAFFRTNLSESLRSRDPRYARWMRKLVDESSVGAEEIAAKIRAGVAKGEFRILTHASARRFWMLKRLLPYRLYEAAMRRAGKGGSGRKQPQSASSKG
ncbi:MULTISPECIES: SDR family oxidoreductase [Lysobacter]|uniref:SDR family oxidoreductase n=1 Tax=Lysobacter TaxID=68 RepID=UPI001F39C4AF|nr:MULTISPECIES: SDR family oxidoreductase [Lysobacter]UJB21570.1 SDR family oxidoreductase [Lysobacter capsici]UJQ29313.1 SDR family oxidoreductase [Lysobacter gummosus]